LYAFFAGLSQSDSDDFDAYCTGKEEVQSRAFSNLIDARTPVGAMAGWTAISGLAVVA
jgi:hypothetical protein